MSRTRVKVNQGETERLIRAAQKMDLPVAGLRFDGNSVTVLVGNPINGGDLLIDKIEKEPPSKEVETL